MSGIFEHDMAFAEADRVAARQAVSVACQVARERFGPFIAASTDEDFDARMSLIAPDLEEVAQEAVSTYGGDLEKVQAAVKEVLAGECPDHLKEYQFKPKGDTTDDGDASTDINSELAEAPSAVGEGVTARWEVVAFNPLDLAGKGLNLAENLPGSPLGPLNNIIQHPTNPMSYIPGGGALAQGIGQGVDAVKGLINGGEDAAKGVGNALGIGGGSTPSAQDIHHQFAMMPGGTGQAGQYNADKHTQQNYDQLAQQMGISPQQVQQGLQQYYQQQQGNPNAPSAQPGGPTPQQMAQPVNPAQTQAQTGQSVAQDPRNPANFTGIQQPFNGPPGFQNRGSVHEAEALTTEKLPKGDQSALDGPSPKMDKKEWKPNALNDSGNLKPIDTEGKGSPNPTRQQHVTDIADHTKDPLEQTDAVTESQDVGKEGDIERIHTDTWNGTDGQANPVTSKAGDPDRNPIRTLIEQGFLPPDHIEAAIARFEGN